MKHHSNRMNRLFWVFVGSVVMIGLLVATPVAADSSAGKERLEACADCHEEIVKGFKNTVHGVIDKKGLAKRANAEIGCESCHGNTAKHIDEGGEKGIVMAFKKEAAAAKSKMCLACHHDSHGEYFASAHAKASMDCTSCHSVHKKTKHALLKGHPMKTCYSCHADVFDKFKLNERHKTMECSACHDPHKPEARGRLGGFKQQACFKCHTDKEGPFLYEHAAVKVEGCTACHDVHGSVNRHMLNDQSVTQLCYGCHTVVPGWHSRFTAESNCANCHIGIHGSNFSRMLLK